MIPDIVYGDLLQQKVDVIVNTWNRNIIPWWLLLPQGVSGAIKKQGGYQPFQEVAKFGAIPLGEARLTSAGKLDYQAIIHVAGINMFWLGTTQSVQNSVVNAMKMVNENEFASVAFPLIGCGSGNRSKNWSKTLMLEAFDKIETTANVTLVIYPS